MHPWIFPEKKMVKPRSLIYILIFISFIAHAKQPAKELSALYKNITSLPANAKALKATDYFVGTPTGLNPLGEGTGLDPNPLFTTTKFDCTTYVETVLAIAFSKTEQDVPSMLNKIRYQSDTVDYFHRNHFMVSDWIPSNTKKSFVTEITDRLAQDKSAFRADKKILNKTIWFYHRSIDLLDQQKRPPNEIVGQLSKVPILPVQEEKATYLLANYFRSNEAVLTDKLPDISIVMFVRNIPSIPTLVNHMGFVVKKNGKLYLNHAPQAKPWRVQEVSLEDYFKDMDSHRAPIEGLLFLEIGNDP